MQRKLYAHMLICTLTLAKTQNAIIKHLKAYLEPNNFHTGIHMPIFMHFHLHEYLHATTLSLTHTYTLIHTHTHTDTLTGK